MVKMYSAESICVHLAGLKSLYLWQNMADFKASKCTALASNSSSIYPLCKFRRNQLTKLAVCLICKVCSVLLTAGMQKQKYASARIPTACTRRTRIIIINYLGRPQIITTRSYNFHTSSGKVNANRL